MVDGTVLYCYYMFERKDKSINEKKKQFWEKFNDNILCFKKIIYLYFIKFQKGWIFENSEAMGQTWVFHEYYLY